MNKVSIDKFNEILNQFFNEIRKQFPDSVEIKSFHKYIKINKQIKWIDIFMDSVKGYEKDILEKNDENLDKIDIVNMLNLKTYYDQCDAANKQIIFEYLQTLYLLGCHYRNYTPEFMKVIENVASVCENDE